MVHALHTPGQRASRVALGCLLSFLLALTGVQAQTSSDACSAAAANRYPVGTSCNPLAFNKPAAYIFHYNPGGCNAANRDDAFGNFIATSTLTTVQYTPTGGTDAILHVLQTCTGPSLGCSDVGLANGTETVTLATVPGNTYYVRIQRYNSDAAMNGTLCIFNPTCLYTLWLYDSASDGWGDFLGQAYAEIFVGGVSLGLWTLGSGASGYVNFGVLDGQSVQVIYNTTGLGFYINENSMELTVAGQCQYTTYAPPNVGTPYTVTADCTPSTSALVQDCAGGITLCSNANVINTATTTGCVLDLSATNRGCLSANEVQGTWYYFSPSTGGTLGFTLVPTNPTDDYDFALWGPYDNTQCPSGPPVRCSWFDGTTYNSTTTGMGNGATDVSEGAAPPPASVNGWVQTLNVIAGKVYVLYIDNYSASGQNFTLSWQLTNGASLDCTTLPVEFLTLDAKPRDAVIDVTWATASELNSDHFVVERSGDNENFTDIGTVTAAGNTQFRNDYLFVDPAPLQGANYYRLRQVDQDGSFKHSRVVVAFLGKGADDRPVIFPNPVPDQLQAAFHSPVEGTAGLYVQDALGRTVATSQTELYRGSNTLTMPLDDLARGWYSLRVILPDGTPLQATGFLKQ